MNPAVDVAVEKDPSGPALVAGEPDPELLEACASGDPEAFAQLFEDCQHRVYSIAVRLTGDPAEAADVTQEVFLKLLVRIRQYRRQARFGTWVHRIVVNTFLDGRKGRRRHEPLDEETLAAAGTLPFQDPARAETAADVQRGLSRLDVSFRVPLVLRYVGGLSYSEIAETLRLPAGTVASRISRGLRDLARHMSSRGPK